MITKPLTLADVPVKKDYAPDILERRKKLEDMERSALNLKNELEYLMQKQRENIVLKWRPEIRSCVKGKGINDYYIATHHDIIGCIEYKYCIKADRDIKNKIITNLSAMYANRELGRVEINNEWHYGLAEIFNEDLNTLKRKYLHLLKQ